MSQNVADLVRRLESWGAGRPLPRTRALTLPRVEPADALIVAFVRMAGETLPWGVALGAPGAPPQVETVLDPRRIDEVARLVGRVAPRLLSHVGHPEHDAAPERAAGRQLWVPGGSHLELLSFLDFRFTRAQKGPDGLTPLLNAVGRAGGFLFREAARAGQVRVIDASAALRAAFAFPADDLRQQHLGFLLAWLEAEGDRDARQAVARLAERRSVATTLDPGLERDALAPVFDELRALRKDEAVPEARRRRRTAELAAKVRGVLEPELVRRFELAARAYALLRADPRPVNAGVDDLLELGAGEHEGQYARAERALAAPAPGRRAFVPDAETDHAPAAAASRYFLHEHSREVADAALVHGDPALLADAVARGDALAGVIEAVDDEGTGRAEVPVWTVRAPLEGALRLREGSKVCVAGVPARTARVRSMRVDGGERVVEVVIGAGKRARPAEGAPAATSDALVGAAVTLVASGARGLARTKAMNVWSGVGPGAWLTHAAGGPPASRGAPPGRRRRSLLRIVEQQESTS